MMCKTVSYFLTLFVIPLLFGCTEKASDIVDIPGASFGTRTYYVSAVNGSDSNTGLSENASFKTLGKAALVAAAGDNVLIMAGTYTSTSGPVLTVTKSGAAKKYITYKAFPGQSPKIVVSGNVWEAVLINASYIVLEGIELEGNNQNLTLTGAEKAFNDNIAGLTSPDPVYNTNGISIGKDGVEVHHVIVRNCKVHDFSGGGIGTSHSDYLTIEGNTVYNNCWYTMYGTSGISTMKTKDTDAATTYKIIIRNNVVYNNKTLVKWKVNATNQKYSDGNGIIIDANQGTQGTFVYNGRILIENNVSFNNGGGGIHCFQTAHVDVVNNTTYNNGLEMGYPEIDASFSTDVKIYNNIMYARSTAATRYPAEVIRCNGNDAGSYLNNVYFNGTFFNAGTTNKNLNPLFVQLPAAGNMAFNFSLQAASPAINAGTSVLFSEKDIAGTLRPKGNAVDCGAYEVN